MSAMASQITGVSIAYSTVGSGADHWFLCCSPKQAVEQTVRLPVIWDTTTLMWRHWTDYQEIHAA